LTVLSVIAFGAKRWAEMVNFVDAQIKTTTYENFFAPDFQYDGGTEFRVAAAMTDSFFD